jgi:hypothetical protein
MGTAAQLRPFRFHPRVLSVDKPLRSFIKLVGCGVFYGETNRVAN